MDTWATVSSLATGAGTLVLAVATFASVRSANRAARIAEAAFRQQLRPVLVPSALGEPRQKIMFLGGRWVGVEGGTAAVEVDDSVVYMVMSLRNVGSGIAVLQSWRCEPQSQRVRDVPELEDFRAQSRDLYIPAGGTGLWQGALREPSEVLYGDMRTAIAGRDSLTIDLLYSDHTGGQRTISRFLISPAGDDRWLTGVIRHWNLDQPNPR